MYYATKGNLQVSVIKYIIMLEKPDAYLVPPSQIVINQGLLWLCVAPP